MAADTDQRPPRRLRGLPSRTVLGRPVPVASRSLARLLGLALLGRERAGPGLLLPGCRAVHTVGMRFPLDVVFLARSGAVLRVERWVGPGRFVADHRAAAVLELPAGASGLGPGLGAA